MLISCSCGLSFKCSRLHIHQQQSKDPQCKNGSSAEDIEIAVNPHGDLFGDYDSYLLDEHQMDISDEGKDNNTSSFDSSDSDHDDDNEFDTALAEQEHRLEPDHHQTSAPNLTGGMDEEPH